MGALRESNLKELLEKRPDDLTELLRSGLEQDADFELFWPKDFS